MVRTNATKTDHVKLFISRLLVPFVALPLSMQIVKSGYAIAAVIVLALIWYRYGIILMHKCGLDRLVFQMELIIGCDKNCLVWGVDQSPIVGTCIKMEKPEDLDAFRKKVLTHFH